MEREPTCFKCETPLVLNPKDQLFYECQSLTHVVLVSRKFFRRWELEQQLLVKETSDVQT